jgi:hypothetical protein
LLKSLSEQYARRAREFADAVALLGRHNSVGPEVLKLCKKIKRQHQLCGDAEKKFERYIQHEIEDPEAAGAVQR